MLDRTKIIDNMNPLEFRFNKNNDFIEFLLPLTKYKEQYLLVKQKDKKYNSIHYYIISSSRYQVIGRFDISDYLENEICGITYHIIDEFQNRGIGQTVLGVVVNDIFSHQVNLIRILPINEKSAHIAEKIGFTPRSKRIYELNSLDYQEIQSNCKKNSI